MASKPKSEKTEKTVPTIQDILSSVMEANKADFLNDFPDQEYKVSTGSIRLDFATNGGAGPGVTRLMGVTEGGKTSEALVIMLNFLKKFKAEGGRGLYIRAEGRLSKDRQDKSGLTFVTKVEDWAAGTVLILDTNIYEVAAKTIVDIARGCRDSKVCIIVDSLDGLIPRGDDAKEFGDATKVAGGAVIGSLLFKKLGSYLVKFGHMLILISQVRAKMELQYSAEPSRNVSGTGGNAMQHAPDLMLEFWTINNSDRIMEKDGQPDLVDNRILGHMAKVRIKKSGNEKTGYTVAYPIKHGKQGCAIWVEKEIVEFLVDFGYVVKKGSWFVIEQDLEDEVKEFSGETLGIGGLTCQGAEKLEAILTPNDHVTEILKNFILERVIK